MPGQLIIEAFVDPVYAQNSRVVHTGQGNTCWLIDPGFTPAADQTLKYLSEKELSPQAILLTHAHADHIAGIPRILEDHPDLPVYLARQEWSFLRDPSQNLSMMVGADLQVQVKETSDLRQGDVLELNGIRFEVRETPGHSPGGRTFYCRQEGCALVGDSLFAGSIGRTDFPHSDHDLLLSRIREQLLTLPDETRVLSGHGPDTTVGQEKKSNPFVGAHASFL